MELIDRVELINSLKLLAKFEDATRESVILGIIETIKKQKTVDAVQHSEFNKVRRERDILLNVVNIHYPACKYCKYGRTNSTKFPCADCLQGDRWEWRGVQDD